MLKKIAKCFSEYTRHTADKKEYAIALRCSSVGDKTWQFLLAQMYETGTTAVEKDIIMAYFWYYFSDQNGMKKAKPCMESLESQLTGKQLKEAKENILMNMHNVNPKTKNLLFYAKRFFC